MKKILACLFCLLLVACHQVVKPVSNKGNLQSQSEREMLLQKRTEWGFRGRVAVSDGKQAGTVKMRWQQRGDQFDIEISLPITSQKYRLRSSGSRVFLDAFGATVLEGNSAEAVLQQATGWRIPFREMQLWLRGMRTHQATSIEFGPAGLPLRFRENGWLVDYRAWNAEATPMPMKVFASSDNNGKSASVRLQVDAWESP